MEKHKSGFSELAKKAILSPKESLVEIRKSSAGLQIGIPKEVVSSENRVALTPHAVQLLVSHGYEILVESGAGKEAKFPDRDYSEAGAKICFEREEVFKSNILVKVGFPTSAEIELMGSHQFLMSAMHAPQMDASCLKSLMAKKITAVGYEYLKDESGGYPVIQSMSEIAGNASIQIAAEYLSNINHGKGVMLGGISGIPPSEVVILGAGTVGQFACRAALGLGADVKIFDNSVYKLRRLQSNLSSPIFTSVIHPNVLQKALLTADVLIGAIRADHGRSPVVVPEDMVMKMKPGSVIVDVSIDQGGCIETSETTTQENPAFERYGVIHYGIPNIPSRVARTASYALSNLFSNAFVDVAKYGGFKNYVWEKEHIRESIYVYNGKLTDDFLADKFGMTAHQIDLLLAARI